MNSYSCEKRKTWRVSLYANYLAEFFAAQFSVLCTRVVNARQKKMFTALVTGSLFWRQQPVCAINSSGVTLQSQPSDITAKLLFHFAP